MCLPAFSNQYRYHTTVGDLAESGFLERTGNLGRNSRGVPDAPPIRTVAGAMPNQACVTGRACPALTLGGTPAIERRLDQRRAEEGVLPARVSLGDTEVDSV